MDNSFFICISPSHVSAMHISPSATINLLLLSRSPSSRYAYHSNTHATASRVDLSVRHSAEDWSGLPFDEAHSDHRYQGSIAAKRQKVNCSSMLSPQVLCFIYLRPSRHEIMSRKHLVLSDVAQRPGSFPPAEELSVHKTARVRPPGAESVTIALASTQGQV